MNIPKSYEALAADLASEKILSKTLLGQKEAYMMLTDNGRLDLATWKQKACEAAEREAALREELAALRESYEAMRDRKSSIVYLQQRLTSAEQREAEAREELLDLSRKLDVFYSRSHGIKNLSAIEDANDKSKALQQRLTVAEQRAEDLESALINVRETLGREYWDQYAGLDETRDILDAALKPAEVEGS